MNDIEYKAASPYELLYIDQGLFTAFIPVSKAGEVAFNQMAKDTDDIGKVDGMLRELGIE